MRTASPLGAVKVGSERGAMHLDVRTIESGSALEMYLCATPGPAGARGDPEARAQRMFASVREAAWRKGARICRQRVFVPEGRLQCFRQAHLAAGMGGEPAGVTDWLWAGGGDDLGGIQAHAVRGPVDWSPLNNGGEVVGWAFRQNGHQWAVTGDVQVPGQGDAPAQATRALEISEALLRQAGMDLRCVARTWFFLDDILSWYSAFNQGRNRLFIERGLLQRGKGDASQVPASTGMGVRPVAQARVALELFAVASPGGGIKRYSAAGKQRSPYEYGSAFARASEAPTPAGRTVFISGTAAIDQAGATCHAGDVRGQIQMTINNVLAVVRDTGCSSRDVVQAIAYCKSAEVVREFRRTWASELSWPWLIVIGDVCRDDLLFEAEVTLCQASGAG